MFWNILDALGVLFDGLGLLSGSSSEQKEEEGSKRFVIKLFSTIFILIGLFLLFFTFKSPIPIDNSLPKMLILSFVGIILSFFVCFIFYRLGIFYFRNLSTMVCFCFSLIFVSITSVVCLYFKSGLFI